MIFQKLIDHACDGDKRAIMASYVGAENAANPSVELLEMMHDVTLQKGVAKLIQSWIDPDDWQRFTKLS